MEFGKMDRVSASRWVSNIMGDVRNDTTKNIGLLERLVSFSLADKYRRWLGSGGLSPNDEGVRQCRTS